MRSTSPGSANARLDEVVLELTIDLPLGILSSARFGSRLSPLCYYSVSYGAVLDNCCPTSR
jgi:hypothetical protein